MKFRVLNFTGLAKCLLRPKGFCINQDKPYKKLPFTQQNYKIKVLRYLNIYENCR